MQHPTAVDVFLQDGALSRAFPGYRERPQQIEMVRRVEEALRGSGQLLIEAPTGVGKSLAYLVPAILSRRHGDRPVLVVTDNIALQEQLIEKDLPLLRRVLDLHPPLSFALAKGRTNYVCREAAQDVADVPTPKGDPTTAQQDQILSWVNTTLTGDRSDLPFIPSDVLWSRFTRDSTSCVGPFGLHCSSCFIAKARTAWLGADVVVANYHLLFSDLLRGGTILPDRSVLILDEAHRMVPIARECLGIDLSHAMIRRAVTPLWGELPPGAMAVDPPPGLGLMEEQEKKAYDHNHVRHRTIEVAGVLFDVLHEQLERGNYRLLGVRQTLPVQDLSAYLAWAARCYEAYQGGEIPRNKREALCRQLGTRCKELRTILKDLTQKEDGVEYYHVEDTLRKERSTRVKSIILDPTKWLDGLYKMQPNTILTSATLRLGGTFQSIQRDAGLVHAATAAVTSPFDYANNVLLVTPNLQRDPPKTADARAAYAQDVARCVENIVRASKGRTLALFTANDNKNVVANHLRKCGLPYTILCQGDAPKMQLIRRFQEDESSVLVGVNSFWQGVDIPGPSLSCLVMDRLPFEPSNRPVPAAFTERYPDAFERYTLPTASVQFLQGFGRLIRSVDDRGVVVVLDRRVYLNASWKRWFLGSLPQGIPHVLNLDLIESFLGGVPIIPVSSPFR